MAHSFNLRVKQVSLGFSTSPLRAIGLLLVGGLLALVGIWQSWQLIQSAAPGEALAVQSITLPTRDSISVDLRNSGSDPLTVAQVQVDAAYWTFTIEPGALIQPNQQATLKIRYLWMQNEQHTLTIVTSTGATVEAQVDATGLSPTR